MQSWLVLRKITIDKYLYFISLSLLLSSFLAVKDVDSIHSRISQ